MALDTKQFRHLLRETLSLAGWYSDRVEEMLFAIAAHESHLGTYLWQRFGGPARGLFGMEVGTMNDIWDNYLIYPSHEHHRATIAIISGVSGPSEWALTSNLAYQIGMARLDLFRDKDPLPDPEDVDAIADYWKKNWNTMLGAGTIEKFKKDYLRFRDS